MLPIYSSTEHLPPREPTMRPPIHEHRRFFACSSRPLSAVGSSPLAAMVMLTLFPFVTSAVGDVVVTGDGTPVIVTDVPSIGANLSFVAGDGSPAVLQLLSGGIYSGEWSITNVPAIFDLNGGSLVIAPGVGTGTASGDANVGVVNGALQLGTNSFLTGFGTTGSGGTLSAIQGGRLVIDDDRWLSNMVLLQLGGAWTSGSEATLAYSGNTSITSAAGVSLEGGTASAIALSGAGSLTLTGDISGTGDLVITTAGGTGSVNLSFVSGSFDGKTVIDNATASLNTQNSIGTQGLTFNSATVTAGTALTLGTGQVFDLGGTSTLTGGGPGLTAFNVNGGMTGSGDITLTGMNMTVGGTTSTYTGGISLAGAAGSESTLTTTNAAWLGGVSSLTMANNTSLTYAGTDAGTYGGAIITGAAATDRALIFTSGAGNGNLTLSGTVAGTGDLVIGSAGGSTATTTLAFSLGTLEGHTVIENANVAINTQASIGAAGLSLSGANVTLGTALTLRAADLGPPATPDQVFDLTGTSTLTGGGAGLTAFTVNGGMTGGGALTLSGISMNVGGTTASYNGTLTLDGSSTLTTSNQQLLSNVASITLGNGTSLAYDGTVAGNYSGPLNVTGASATIATSGATAGDFTVDGTVTATDIVVSALNGSTATTVLAFDSASSITGRTIIDGAKARINTSDSVGTAGLSLTDGDLTLGTALTLGAGQAFAVNGTSSVTGSGGANTLFNVNEAMSGTGTLTLSGVDLSVGAAASTFTGGVALEAGSTASTSNVAWLGSLTSLTLNADATATQFTYTGNATATYAGTLISGGTAAATVATSGAGTGALNFTGTVDGSGDLVFKALSGSTATTTLAFTSSTFTGTTVIDTMSAAVNTQASVGGAGMRILGSQVGIGADLSLDATQSLTIGGTTTLTGLPAGTTTLVVDGGLNVSGASANLTLSQLSASIGSGGTSNFAGDVTLTSGSALSLTDGADLSDASVFSDALNSGGAVTVGGDGTLANIGSVGNAFKGLLNPGDRNNAGSSTLAVTGDVILDATSTTSWYLLDSTGKADRLDAGGAFTLNGSAAKIIYDADFYSGAFIPASGVTVDYVMATAGTLDGTFSTVDVVTIDPLTGLATDHAVNATGATYFMGGAFEVSYAGNEFSLQIIGQGGSYPLPAGTTSTNVVVDVQTGHGTVKRNANVGTVNNSQINASAAAITAIATGPVGSDEQYVATELLLLTPGAFASAEVALSNVSNPYALPNVTMNQLFQAGNVAMKRLMQLRESTAPTTVAPLLSSKGGVTDQESLNAGSAVVTGNSFTSFGAPLNGPTPDDGARWWSRGYGFTNSVSDDTWAKTSYSSATGGLMFGADMVLGKGFIAGAFIGYMPGTVDITGGLVDETDTINGANVGIYGSWVPDSGQWYVEAAAQGGYAGVDRTRDLYIPGVVRTATSDNSLWAASVNSEIGMNIRIGGDMFVQPYAAVAAGYVGQSSYTEQGAGSANLDVSSQSAVMLQPTIGSRIMHTLRIDRDVLTPYIGSAFIANVPIGDWDVTATNAYSATPGYTVYGSPETRYGASFEAGVEFASYKGITAYCSFNGMQFENEQQYGGQIGVIVPF
jgi:hypothetical protein